MRVVRRASLITAAGALLAASTLTVSAHAAGKQTGGAPSNAMDAAALRQAPSVKLGRLISRWVEQAHVAGFTGMAIAPGDSALVVYWKGQSPQVLQDLAGRSNGALSLRSVPHSLAELDAVERVLMRIPGVEQAGVLSDFSGLEVTAADSTSAAAAQSIAGRAHVSLLAHVGPSTVVPTANRTADVGPFYGGDEVFHQTTSTSGVGCSTGFEIAHNGDNTNALSTANHCGEGVAWSTYAGGIYLGSSVTCSPVTTCEAVDTIPITFGNALPNNDYAPQVWVGAYNSSTATPVVGQGSAIVNQVLCIDGAYTGEVCGNTVQSVNQYIHVYSDGTASGPGFWTTQPAHLAAAGSGDSGAPVIDTTSSGAVGYGTEDAVSTNGQVACTGNPARTGTCSYLVFSLDLGHMLSGIGAYLVTAPNNGSCSNVEDVALKDLAAAVAADSTAVC